MRRLGLWFIMMVVLGFGLVWTSLPLHAIMIIGGTTAFVGGAWLSYTGRV